MLRPDRNPQYLPAKIKDLHLKVGDKKLINGVSFTLSPHGRLAILGHNGAGKSLLLRLLHGLIEPCKGEISWAGRPMNKAIKKTQAMVFQRPILLRRSVEANLHYPLKLHGIDDKQERAAIINEMLILGDLEHLRHQPARVLSGGEQQRLAMVRALSFKPEILFLDEPTASLDPNATLAIENLILEAHRSGCKIILVTHDIGQARRLSDEVMFMSSGTICEQQPTEDFFSQTKPGAPGIIWRAGLLPVRN